MQQIINRRTRALAALVLALSALVLGACESKSSGMYQGGSDSSPGWR